MEIDLLELLSPPQAANTQSDGISNNSRRRFGKAPTNWHTIGIGTKELLFYEISFYTSKEQQTVYSKLFDLSMIILSTFLTICSKRTVLENCWFSYHLSGC